MLECKFLKIKFQIQILYLKILKTYKIQSSYSDSIIHETYFIKQTASEKIAKYIEVPALVITNKYNIL